MTTVKREHKAGLEMAHEKTGLSIPVLAELIAQANAAPEQESVAWLLSVEGYKDVLVDNYQRALSEQEHFLGRGRTCVIRNLYTHADPSEVERLREERDSFQRVGISAMEQLAEAQALLARVINSGALTCEQYAELEADICAAVDVMAALKRLEFKDHLAKCAEEVAAMPAHKRECLKSSGSLSASAQPADGAA